jgi:hypothetical protein
MADAPQSYANHVRWHPIFHFFLAPVMLVNFIRSVVLFIKQPGWTAGEWVVMSFALVVLTLLVRVNPLRAQDRIIRLEEQLRYQRVLPPDLAARASQLSIGQIVALRFASDAELPELARQTLDGKFAKPAEIKKAIKNWRADTLRV